MLARLSAPAAGAGVVVVVGVTATDSVVVGVTSSVSSGVVGSVGFSPPGLVGVVTFSTQKNQWLMPAGPPLELGRGRAGRSSSGCRAWRPCGSVVALSALDDHTGDGEALKAAGDGEELVLGHGVGAASPRRLLGVAVDHLAGQAGRHAGVRVVSLEVAVDDDGALGVAGVQRLVGRRRGGAAQQAGGAQGEQCGCSEKAAGGDAPRVLLPQGFEG